MYLTTPSTGGGGGGISGSGTDNHIVRWDGTSAVQDSLVIIDDAGAVTGSTSITMGQTTWNNVNGMVSTQDLSFTCGSNFDLNFTGGFAVSNVNFVASGGAVNIVAQNDCTFGSVGGAFIFNSGTSIDLNAGTQINANQNIVMGSKAILWGTSNEGSISYDGIGFIFNSGPTVASEMVVGTTSGTADRNLRAFRMGLLGSATSGTVGLNCVVTGAVRTALNFIFTVTSGTILAPLVLNTINSTSGTATIFANTFEYTHNTTTATGSVSIEMFRVNMGTAAAILLPATTHYIRGMTLDLTGKGAGGVHVAGAIIRNTGIFQPRMTLYAGAATNDNNGSFWGDDVVLQSGTKLLFEGSETHASTSLTITKGDTYMVYDTGTTELQTFVNGVKVLSATSTAINALVPVTGVANFATASVDFGFASGEGGDVATVTVAATWVLAGSKILCVPFAVATADHDPEDYALEGITAYATNIIAGVSFDVIASAPNGTFGLYTIHCVGV
jgi:hypothetical protein